MFCTMCNTYEKGKIYEGCKTCFWILEKRIVWEILDKIKIKGLSFESGK